MTSHVAADMIRGQERARIARRLTTVYRDMNAWAERAWSNGDFGTQFWLLDLIERIGDALEPSRPGDDPQ